MNLPYEINHTAIAMLYLQRNPIRAPLVAARLTGLYVSSKYSPSLFHIICFEFDELH